MQVSIKVLSKQEISENQTRLIIKLVTPTNDICSEYVKLNVFDTNIQLIKSHFAPAEV